jgi:uncharacterized protein YjiS (DUF1127 family)
MTSSQLKGSAMNTPELPFGTLRAAHLSRDHALVRALQTFARALATRVLRTRERWRVRRETRAVFRVLHGLDDRTLRDLGFHRCEIWSVAAEATGEAESTRMRTILHPRAPR